MEIKDFISTEKEYKAAEDEIRTWVENTYHGLSIEFDWPAPEVVQVDKSVRYTKRRVRKIIEVVNIKIGEILEKRAERLYIAERLERIYAKHPDFNIDVESIEDIKTNPKFLRYLDELIIRG